MSDAFLLSGTPVTAGEFAALMARCGPFAARPRLAVAVSGGADSLALLLLAREWAAARGGAVLALSVDHGLRPEAAAELLQVGQWLAGLGVAQEILLWTGDKPGAGILEAARDARFRLLLEACHRLGVFHLLLGHHADDQAETVLMRLARGSGAEGLAAMPLVGERLQVRVLRPLLGVGKARLQATCRARGQPWLDDPANQRLDRDRGRLRAAAPALAGVGLATPALALTAARLGEARAMRDEALAILLGEAATVDPLGWVRLRLAPLRAAPVPLQEAALARCLGVVGGGGYPPRRAALARVATALREGRFFHAATLAGCRLQCWLTAPGAAQPSASQPGDCLWIMREAAAVGPGVTLADGAAVVWDGRFHLSRIPGAPPVGPQPVEALEVGALGGGGWTLLRRHAPALARLGLPGVVARPVAVVLPALRDSQGTLRGVPSLGWWRDGVPLAEVRFVPPVPLAGAPFLPSWPSGFAVA